MQHPIDRIVLATLVALLAPLGRRSRAGREISIPRRHLCRAVPAGRLGRRAAADRRREAARTLGPAGGHREPPRRRGLHRQRQRGPQRPGWLHPARNAGRTAGDQRTGAEDAALYAWRVRPGRAAGAVADRAHGAAEFSGQHRRGVHPLCQGQSRQAELRLAGSGLDLASDRRDVPAADRQRDGACALSRHRPGAGRYPGRQCRSVLRQPRLVDADASRRQGKNPRRRHARAIEAAYRSFRPCARRACAILRRAHGSRWSRRPERLRRSPSRSTAR